MARRPSHDRDNLCERGPGTPRQRVLGELLSDEDAPSQPGEALELCLRRLARHPLPCHAIVALVCPACGLEDRVALTCSKGCPRCGGSRPRSEWSRLIPRVPVRHWVLSLPVAWRDHVGIDARLARAVARVFTRCVFNHLERMRPTGDESKAMCGGVAVVHRAGSRLNLNIHVHALVLDGVYVRDTVGSTPTFRPAAAPEPVDMDRIAREADAAVRALLPPAALTVPSERERRDAVSLRQYHAAGPEVIKVEGGSAKSRRPPGIRGRVAGLEVHASTKIPADARYELVRLCRYLQRPTVDLGRLRRRRDGRYLYRLERPFHDGTTAVVFRPEELVDTLRQLVPDKPICTVGYHGVLASRAAKQWFVRPHQLALPGTAPPSNPEQVAALPRAAPRSSSGGDTGPSRDATSREDMACRRCGKRMRVRRVEEAPGVR